MIYIKNRKNGTQLGCLGDVDLTTYLTDARQMVHSELNTCDYQLVVCGMGMLHVYVYQRQGNADRINLT
jgi:hypothetical protein